MAGLVAGVGRGAPAHLYCLFVISVYLAASSLRPSKVRMSSASVYVWTRAPASEIGRSRPTSSARERLVTSRETEKTNGDGGRVARARARGGRSSAERETAADSEGGEDPRGDPAQVASWHERAKSVQRRSIASVGL